jgi:hypothetical protein
LNNNCRPKLGVRKIMCRLAEVIKYVFVSQLCCLAQTLCTCPPPPPPKEKLSNDLKVVLIPQCPHPWLDLWEKGSQSLLCQCSLNFQQYEELIVSTQITNIQDLFPDFISHFHYVHYLLLFLQELNNALVHGGVQGMISIHPTRAKVFGEFLILCMKHRWHCVNCRLSRARNMKQLNNDKISKST